MATVNTLISCNLSSSHPPPPNKHHSKPSPSPKPPTPFPLHSNPTTPKTPPFLINKLKGPLQLRRCTQTPKEPPLSSSPSSSVQESTELLGGGGGGEERDWTTSFLLLAFWAGLIYYVFFLAPDQTPVTDLYFVKKLLNLKGGDGFEMNQVLVAEWYMMGLWPLVYTMLLIPTGRSSKSKIHVWPFLVLSCFGGAYALIPYFVLWKPPAPPVEESELRRWPLKILESKLTAGVTLAAGVALMVYALSSGGDAWKEFYQYFQGSKFIHIMSIDFSLLSTFASFWVYNDSTARKWDSKGSWLLPLSLIPLLGPSLYLLLRPSLSVAPTSDES